MIPGGGEIAREQVQGREQLIDIRPRRISVADSAKASASLIRPFTAAD